MQRILLLLCAVALFATSCTIKQEVTIEKDLGGTLSYTIDMSQMMALAGDEMGGDDNNSLMQDESFAESMDALRKIDGIKNVTVEEDASKGFYKFGLGFDDLGVLNQALSGSDMRGSDNSSAEDEDFTYIYAKKKGKFIHFELPKIPKSEESMAGMDDLGEGMADLMRYQLVMRFERPIKKVKTKLEHNWDKAANTVTIDLSISDLLSESKPFELDIMLK